MSDDVKERLDRMERALHRVIARLASMEEDYPDRQGGWKDSVLTELCGDNWSDIVLCSRCGHPQGRHTSAGFCTDCNAHPCVDARTKEPSDG